MKQLILGGARSGKSRLAQDRASQMQQPVTYIATARVYDDEMAARVAKHKLDRPDAWQVLEVPEALPEQLSQLSGSGQTVLVDCLTLWVTNLLMQDIATLQQGIDNLCSTVSSFEGELILVSNEVGWGVVPMGELSRQFQDHAGLLHQRLGEIVDQVTLTVAGLPLEIKQAEA